MMITILDKDRNQETMPEISFHAIARTNHPQTIRVLGKLRNKNIIMLIDDSSTHNFNDQAIVTRYGIPMIRDKKFQVMVANKEKIESVGCKFQKLRFRKRIFLIVLERMISACTLMILYLYLQQPN